MLRSLPVSGPPASVSRRSTHVRAALKPSIARGSLLERPADAREPIHEVVAAPTIEVLTSTQFDRGFHEYQAATQQMQDLEKLSAQLLLNLEELNSAVEVLDALPTPAFYQPEHQEARRAKRAAAREARKTQTSVAPAAAPAAKRAQAQSQVVSGQPQPSLQETRELLEGLLLHDTQQQQSSSAATEARPSPASAAAPERVPRSSATAPAVAPVRPSPELQVRRMATRFASSSGPSLLPVPMSARTTDVQAEPSVWAREANARRARSSSRRGASAAGAFGDASKMAARGQSGSDGTTQFMKKAATLDLLSGISEKELTAIVKDLLFIERVKKELKSILKREPSMDEWARAISMDARTFAARVSAGQQAKAMMLQANYRLVISVCKKYQNRGIALQDLITEGVQGLLKGVEKFDADKGFRFSTYAHWWIRQAVTRSLSDQGRTVRLPAHMYEMLTRIQAVKAQLIEEMGKEPSMEQLSERAQLSAERIKEVLEMSAPSSSLDMAIGDDDGMASMKDMLEDERSTPDEVLEEVMLRKDLTSILSELNEREAGVIRLRFGLDGETEMTLEDIGVHFNVTRERIRQIEAKAVRKLKQKQKELVGILQEYSSSRGDAEIVGRRSQGTNKSR